MARYFWLCLAPAAVASLGTPPAASTQPVPPKTLDDLFAPVVVGTPPVNAFNGLFRCPDGEIRHYGDDGFLFSRDNGLTWKHRLSAFENVLADWSTHKYLKGIVGHCAYNRLPGPGLIPHPDKPGAKVLQIRHPLDPKLVFDKDGAVWNFPAAVNGSFTTRIKLLPGGGGGRISLVDRWFNPTDPVVQDYSMYALTLPGDGRLGNDVVLTSSRWHELRFDWSDSQSSICKVTINGGPTTLTLPLVRPSVNGISYVHFQALAEAEDQQGFLVESVEGGR